MAEVELGGGKLERLLEVGRELVSERELDRVLDRILAAARELTGARYAALGVLAANREELERFVTSGIDEDLRAAIGSLPRGKGVLGELIRHPRPLRLADIATHPRSYGFPPHHPPMTTFLGTPVVIRGEAWGNLYLTDKEGGEQFQGEDERIVVALAQWAAVAIDNARLYTDLGRRQRELEKAVGALEASADISRLGVADLLRGRLAALPIERLLELIARRARDLMSARTVLVLLPEGDDLVVAAAAGERTAEIVQRRVAGSHLLAEVIRSGRPRRFTGREQHLLEVPELGLSFTSGLCAPLPFRDRARGMLAVLDRLGGGEFAPGDELILDTFAVSAATAVTTARTVEVEKLHLSIEAAENERRRWARELHDETLQDLGGLRVALEVAARSELPPAPAKSLQRAIEHAERGIDNLQRLITELRPAALDELGLEAAVETWLDELRSRRDLHVEAQIELEHGEGGSASRLAPDLEATAYRIIQEGLNNVVKHARTGAADVRLVEDGETLVISVSDHGTGFDPARRGGGFGLLGMEERAALVGGSLQIESAPGAGTTIRAELPLRRVDQRGR